MPIDTRPLAIFLMGPTATGKTALACELSDRFPLELVSVDSALVYRGLDIGTAKPDAATLARHPHALVDIRDPAEPYSAADFRADALAAIQQISARGRVPLLVGEPGCISVPCSVAWRICPKPTRRPVRGWWPKRADTAGRRCTRVWPGSTRWPPAVSVSTTRSGCSGRWKYSSSPVSHCRSCSKLARAHVSRGGCSSWRCCRLTGAYCMNALPGVSM